MSIWKNKDNDKDILIFISEFSIRQGNKGWKIASLFDNRDGSVGYSHELLIYEKNNSLWKSNKDQKRDWVWSDSEEGMATAKELNLKMPNEQWFNGVNYVNDKSNASKMSVFFKESKSWSGIWIEDSSSSSPQIFDNIKISMKDEKNSFLEIDDAEDSADANYQKDMEGIKKSKGKWLDAEEFCKVGNKRKKDMQQDEIKNLKMFCFKPKNSLLEETD